MDRREFLAAMTLSVVTLVAVRPGHAEEERKRGGGENFVQIPTLAATIMHAGGRRGVMTLEIGVDVPNNAALRTRANESVPRLRAAFAGVLQTYAAGLSPGAVPNADYLARELQRQTDIVLGRPGARLLLGSLLVN